MAGDSFDSLTGGASAVRRPDRRFRLADPRMGDEEVAAVARVLRSGMLTNGPCTPQFEEAFAHRHQVGHAVAVANGTLALAAIYIALGIGAGDEVIVPSMTFISSATSVCHVGATPVFADICPDTFCLDPTDVARRITPRTKAILAVHYGGQPADLVELADVAAGAGVDLLEDAAQAHGAWYRGRPVGGHGRAAMFSFTPTKNITTGEGGVITTDDAAMAERLRLLRNHGQTSPYRHELLGFNWRMTEMQAAMGVVQLGRLDAILAAKSSNAARMADRLKDVPGIRPPVARPDRDHAYMLYTLTVDHGRDRLLAGLLDAGVEARVYFPPAHRQPVFADQHSELPVTDEVAEHMLSIPFHGGLSRSDLEALADVVERTAAEVGAGPGAAIGAPPG